MNAFIHLSEYGQSDHGVSHLESIFMDVAMWEYYVRPLAVANFTGLTPLSLLILRKSAWLGVKLSSLLTWHLNLLKAFTYDRESIEVTFQFLIEALLHIVSFIFCFGA
jgi:hypothetical protein